MPGPSDCCVTYDECGCKQKTYTPTCAKVRTPVGAGRRIERPKEVPTYKWVVENVLRPVRVKCQAETAANQKNAAAAHVEPTGVMPVSYQSPVAADAAEAPKSNLRRVLDPFSGKNNRSTSQGHGRDGRSRGPCGAAVRVLAAASRAGPAIKVAPGRRLTDNEDVILWRRITPRADPRDMARRHDIDRILQEWPYEPGEISGHRVRATDGREVWRCGWKWGFCSSRPRAVPTASVRRRRTYFDQLSRQAAKAGEVFELTPNQFAEADREFMQYYHRRVCWLARARIPPRGR